MLKIYKPIGTSCLELINDIKNKNNYNNIGFAGRLDEMAHGEMIVLINDETKNPKKYHNLNKIYKFRFIIGLETDTTSILGIMTCKKMPNDYNLDNIINEILSFKNKEFEQEFHVFSSFCPKNMECKKPLWWWFNNNRIDEIKVLPSKKVTVFDVKVDKISNISLDEFMKETFENLSTLQNNKLRKEQVIDQWKKYYDDKKNNKINFQELTCEIHVSSGFYIRQFVKDLGKKFNINVLVTEIFRIGHF